MVEHIATIEIPVKNLKESIEWYTKHLELTCVFEGETNAMLSFHTNSPTIFLVQTEEVNSISFLNSYTGVKHRLSIFIQ